MASVKKKLVLSQGHRSPYRAVNTIEEQSTNRKENVNSDRQSEKQRCDPSKE